MQTETAVQVQQAPPPPPPPTATAPGMAPMTLTQAPPPLTRREYRAIEERRGELSNQITSASNRRDRLADQIANTTDPAIRAGLEQRLKVLDDRIAQLELDIAETGRQLTSAPASALVPPDAPPWEQLGTDQITAISIVFTIFVLFPLAFSASRLLWRRATTPPPRRDPADAERYERLEHAIETIAVEVERIGEGQRFVTRLLTESNSAVPLPKGKDEAFVRARGNEG